MTSHLLAFLAAICLVGLKSWQQQNVTHEKLWWIPPTSYALAAFELYLWSKASGADVWLWFAIGSGASIGSLSAVLIHRRLRAASPQA